MRYGKNRANGSTASKLSWHMQELMQHRRPSAPRLANVRLGAATRVSRLRAARVTAVGSAR